MQTVLASRYAFSVDVKVRARSVGQICYLTGNASHTCSTTCCKCQIACFRDAVIVYHGIVCSDPVVCVQDLGGGDARSLIDRYHRTF